jgi:hypothetical protein
VTRVLLLLALAAPAFGWDTAGVKNPDGSESWRSVYQGGPAQLLPAPQGFSKNEHAELAHLSFFQLGIANLFGIITPSTGSARLDVVDLNASLARPELMALDRFGDDLRPGYVLEERIVPSPAHFAGLPDFEFSVYDWINKSSLCPPAPDAALVAYCHVYFGGFLTLFNSTHFGTQSAHVHRHYHRIARALGKRALALRATLETRSADDAAAHVAYVREAELEALAYEGFAQHFLQDRWSLGHMWERWNGGDERKSADFITGSLAGAVAGLIHGSEALTGLPDPMSSPPVVGGLVATPLFWLSRADGLLYQGLGDERLLDMYDGFFGLPYGLPDLPVPVPVQKARMLDCMQAGWVEVIKEFGEDGQGGWGAWNVPLPPTAFPPLETNLDCFDNFATNSAIRAGWVDDVFAADASKIARALVVLNLPVPIPATLLSLLRSEMTALTARVRSRAKTLPLGTNLARGQIETFLGIEPGDFYAVEQTPQGPVAYVPEYAEPEDLAMLDDEPNPRGRDKPAVFGFFNRAHVDHWCTGIQGRLASLRGSDDPVKEAACGYLAERVYKGTDAAYAGARVEQAFPSTPAVEPICANWGVQTDEVDDALPYRLHPGYVGAPNALGPYAHRSIEAWCRKLPVVDRVPSDGSGDPCVDPAATGSLTDSFDVVAIASADAPRVTLAGRWFGGQGAVVARRPEFGFGTEASLPIVSWSPTAIVAEVGALAAGDWFLEIRPAGDASRRSVGRFILRVLPTVCEKPLGFWQVTCERAPSNLTVTFNLLADGTVMSGILAGQANAGGAKVGEWTASGRNVTITRCPFMPGFPSFEFQGEWTPDPTDFDIEVCLLGGPCPGMRGSVTYYDSAGVPAVVSSNCTNRICRLGEGLVNGVPCFQQFPSFGYQRLGPDVRDQTCHGGCWEGWETIWPHNCAPSGSPGACGRFGGSCEVAAAGSCPDGLVCRTLAVAGPFGMPCYCVPVVETPCTTSDQCPEDDQTCTAEVPRNPTWLRNICMNDPADPR